MTTPITPTEAEALLAPLWRFPRVALAVSGGAGAATSRTAVLTVRANVVRHAVLTVRGPLVQASSNGAGLRSREQVLDLDRGTVRVVTYFAP